MKKETLNKQQVIKDTLKKLKEKGLLDEGAIKNFIKATNEAREYYNAKGNFKDTKGNYDKKDEYRIQDIIEYSKGDENKAERLAQNMAMKITDVAKAIRRANAAAQLGYKQLASIFNFRARQLQTAH